jgi:hypothetical protein
MRHVDEDVPAADMVVSIDTGDEVALHPKNKKPIGIRHALLAMEQTYEKDVVGRGVGSKNSAELQHAAVSRLVATQIRSTQPLEFTRVIPDAASFRQL